MTKKKSKIAIHSSAAEYLTYVASIGDRQDSMEMRYKDENICFCSDRYLYWNNRPTSHARTVVPVYAFFILNPKTSFARYCLMVG